MKNTDEINKTNTLAASFVSDSKSGHGRPNFLSLPSQATANCSSIIKELFSPSSSIFANLSTVANFGNVILASPGQITPEVLSHLDGLSPRSIFTTNSLTHEQMQVDEIFDEKFKEIKAQEQQDEKRFINPTGESRIIIVSQNALDQLHCSNLPRQNECHILKLNPHIPDKISMDNPPAVSSTTVIANDVQSQIYHNNNSNELSSVSSAELSSSKVSEVDRLKVKMDRKRARNRDAARKCRERKLQLMKKLEKDVQNLTQEKGVLENKAFSQKKVIEHLKAVIVQHLNSGCTI